VARLEGDVDLWIATAAANREAHLIPLSFAWHEGRIVMATRADATTVANIRARPRAQVALGHTRDVVLIEGAVTLFEPEPPDAATRDAFAASTGWDAAGEPGYVLFALEPQRIRAWREENELDGREVMRDGTWLD
jgi:general stress protein 26